MAGDPAHIGGAAVDFALAVVEHVAVREHREEQVAGLGVEHAFGFAGRAGGVEDEERVFGVHHLRFGLGGLAADGFVPPDVAPVLHRHVAARVLVDEDEFDAVDVFEGGVDVGLERHRPTAAPTLVLGDDRLAGRVGDAVGDGGGAEAAENDGVDRADAGAGEHRGDDFGGHAHVDGDAVALADAAGAQLIGDAADFGVEVGVGPGLVLAGFVAFPEDGGLLGAGFEVSVEAVDADVELAAEEPADFAGGEVFLDQGVPGRVPLEQRVGHLAPESVGLVEAAPPEALVFLAAAHQRAVAHAGGRRVALVGREGGVGRSHGSRSCRCSAVRWRNDTIHASARHAATDSRSAPRCQTAQPTTPNPSSASP